MDSFLWVEKYRPNDIDSCILPDTLKATFKEFVDTGSLPNLLLAGGPGVGKTTLAKALCNEIGSDYMLINGSEDSGIDVDFDDESEAPSKSYRKRSFTENVKASKQTVNPQSAKASNETKDHHLPSFAANGNQELEMSVNKTAALDHTTIGL